MFDLWIIIYDWDETCKIIFATDRRVKLKSSVINVHNESTTIVFYFLKSRGYRMEIYVTTYRVLPVLLLQWYLLWKANEDAAACNKLDIVGMKKLTTRTRANSSVYGVYASFRWNNNEDPQTRPVSSRCKQEFLALLSFTFSPKITKKFPQTSTTDETPSVGN